MTNLQWSASVLGALVFLLAVYIIIRAGYYRAYSQGWFDREQKYVEDVGISKSLERAEELGKLQERHRVLIKKRR